MIPNFELMLATIGARLFFSVRCAVKLRSSNIDINFWTMSSTVLTCIKSQKLWSVFVNNQIAELRMTASVNWFHTP